MKKTQWLRGCLGILAGQLMAGTRKRRAVSGQDLRRAEYKTSTQGMGLRMTDHIRDVFRFRWLRKHEE